MIHIHDGNGLANCVWTVPPGLLGVMVIIYSRDEPPYRKEKLAGIIVEV